MRKKNNFKSLIINQYTIASIGLVLLVFASIPLAKNLSKQYKINSEIEELQKEIEKMEAKNSELSELIGYLSSDQFVMEQARLNLNYKKPGEEMVVIKDADSLGDKKDEPQEQNTVYQIKGLENVKPPEKISNPSKWLSYFFDK
jgi:cell division protein FtsB